MRGRSVLSAYAARISFRACRDLAEEIVERLGHGRMGADHVAQEAIILSRAHGGGHRVDHFPGIRAVQGATQDLAAAALHHGFEQARGFAQQPGAGNGRRRKFGHCNRKALSAGFGFGQAHAGRGGSMNTV